MNKLFFAAIALFLNILIQENLLSQNFPTDAGSINYGGDLTISNSVGSLYNNKRLSSMETNPYISYFFFQQFSAGLGFDITRNSQVEVSQTKWGVGPYARLYFGEAAPKRIIRGAMYPFLEWGIYFGQTLKETPTDSTFYSGVFGKVGGGICFMLTNSIGFTGAAYFQLERMRSKGGVYYGNSYILSFGFTSFIYRYGY